jgi:hypothetical protein
MHSRDELGKTCFGQRRVSPPPRRGGTLRTECELSSPRLLDYDRAPMATKKKRVFKVVFLNHGRVYEIFAREVSQADLYGFVAVEGLLFGERSSIVVDPSEEKLRSEFAGVERTFVPVHAILRIDEVERRGTSLIRPVADGESKVTPLPHSVLVPTKKGT